jgi:membrane fusion protein (multidrug efflux system)
MGIVATTGFSTRRLLLILVGIVIVAALVIWLVDYLLVGQYFISTDDAYIEADSAMIAAKVSGYVKTVAVNDDQKLPAGALLVEIDPRDYLAALSAAQADEAAAQATIASDKAALSLNGAKIQAAQATLQGDSARLSFAIANQRRYAHLSATGASPIQTADQATTDLATARAALANDTAALLGANRQVDVLNAQAAQAQAAAQQAQARVDTARLNLSHTKLSAPFAGVVGNKTVAVGDYVQPGTQMLAIVPVDQVYVTANYKETQITHIHAGQHVRVVVDAYPGLKVTGVVDSIAPASGQEFALLPPDNATGNFTKIVQRVPVKIDLDLTPQTIGLLRPGMSVEPAIDTRSH